MSTIVTGVVMNGLVVPSAPLPEGAQVEIHLHVPQSEVPLSATPRLTPAELRKMPREQRQAVLAAAAQMAEQDYRDDKELTDFEAFSEEEVDGDQADSR